MRTLVFVHTDICVRKKFALPISRKSKIPNFTKKNFFIEIVKSENNQVYKLKSMQIKLMKNKNHLSKPQK